MSALFLIPLGATSLGGAMALGALFHFFNGRNAATNAASERDDDVAEALDELDRRERSLADFCDRANAELEAKQAALEALTARATEAAAALGRVLDSFSTAFGDSSVRAAATSTTTFEPFRALENDLQAELAFDERRDATRRRIVSRR